MSDLTVEMLALLVYGPLVVLLHELGHAVFARRGGYRVTSFAIGLGKPLWSVYLRDGVVLHLDRWLFAGGACTAIPIGAPTVRRAWFHAGGLLMQVGLAAVLLLMPDHWLVVRIGQFNLLVALTNAVPWRAAGQASDGWYLLDAATGGRKAGSILLQRPVFERMAAREEAVGSPVGRVYSLVCIAWADVLSGYPEAADGLFTDEPPEATVEPWVDGLYHYVLAEWHRASGRPLAAVATARDARSIERLRDEAAALLCLAEARALVDLDAPGQAARALARLSGVGGPIGGQAAAILLWASLDGETSDLELATWRVERRTAEVWLDPADAVMALREATAELEARGRVPAARGAAAAAVMLLERTRKVVAVEDGPRLEARLSARRRPSAETRG